MQPEQVADEFTYEDGTFWLGRNIQLGETGIGAAKDGHVCLVSGTGGGKGTSIIVPNLILWPGSIVVVDPKGENATITAARRGQGDEHAEGMGQKVYVLDPFHEAEVDPKYRARFNPLDTIDPESPDALDEAGRIADALIVSGQSNDPHWDEGARSMVKALILHVITDDNHAHERNLLTVRRLLLEGDVAAVEHFKSLGRTPPSAQTVLWDLVSNNRAMDGAIAAFGRDFRDTIEQSTKAFNSYRKVATQNTEFLDGPRMRELLSTSDFKLSDLKTDPDGVSMYLTLPQRYMNTHFRWLRMMTSLTTTEMEKTKGKPASGHRVLMCLDEFAGLKRMEVIENAIAQIRGFGVQLFFVVQSLEQLKATYPERWETFLANADLKIYFNNNDHFTQEYISKSLGEMEFTRETLNQSESEGSQTNTTSGAAEGQQSTTTRGTGTTEGESAGSSEGYASGRSVNSGLARGNILNIGPWVTDYFTNMLGGNRMYHYSKNSQSGRNQSRSRGTSTQESQAEGRTTTQNYSESTGSNQSRSSGRSEQILKRPLITPDEVAKWFGKVEDQDNPAHPGLALTHVSGKAPFAIRRTNYFEDWWFKEKFSPHPDHEFKPFDQVLAERGERWITANTPRCIRRSGYMSEELQDDWNHEERREWRRRFTTTFEIERPIELVWYVTLDFENWYNWKLGFPMSRPDYVPNEIEPGTFITSAHGGLILHCEDGEHDWNDQYFRNDPHVTKELKIYGGFGYEIALTPLNPTSTRIKFSRLYYYKPEKPGPLKLIRMLAKSETHPSIETDQISTKTEAESFRRKCLEIGSFVRIHHQEPSVEAWVKSMGFDERRLSGLPELHVVRD